MNLSEKNSFEFTYIYSRSVQNSGYKTAGTKQLVQNSWYKSAVCLKVAGIGTKQRVQKCGLLKSSWDRYKTAGTKQLV